MDIRFVSLGKELVRRGIYNEHQVSQAVIKNWVRRNPEAGHDLLMSNPSYVFFRKIGDVSASKGPAWGDEPVDHGASVAGG